MGKMHDELIGYEEKGDFCSLVRAYIKYSAKNVDNVWDSEEEREEFDQIADYIKEKKKDVRYATAFTEELLKYKAEINVNLLMEQEEIAQDIRDGKYPGTELYRDNPRVCYDLAGTLLMKENNICSIFSAIGSALFEQDVYTIEEPIADEDAKRLGLPKGTKLNDLVSKAGQGIMEKHLGEESLLSLSEQRYYNTEGFSAADNSRLYGLEYVNGRFEPYKDDLPENVIGKRFRKVDDEPVIDVDDGQILEGHVHAEAIPEGFARQLYPDHLKTMEKYRSGLKDMVSQAKEHLTQLKKLEGQKKNQSDEFSAMVNALTELTELDGRNTPKQVLETLDRVSKAGKAYQEHIESSVFRGVLPAGRERKRFSGVLSDFADAQYTNMLKQEDHCFNRIGGIDDQINRIRKASVKYDAVAIEDEKAERNRTDLGNLIEKQKETEIKPEDIARKESMKNMDETINKRREDEKGAKQPSKALNLPS